MPSQHGVSIAPSTYYVYHQRKLAPAPRTLRDTELKERIQEDSEANYRVYGARKI